MNPSQFQQWCRELALLAETVDQIARIRFSPPARRVQGGGDNVHGIYPSRKMGVTIQFESHTLELGAIYLMDHDEVSWPRYGGSSHLLSVPKTVHFLIQASSFINR